MSAAVILLLTVLWAAILVPGSLRGRQHRSPVSSVHAFERSMVALASGVRGEASPGAAPTALRPVPAAVARGAADRAARRARTLARRRAVLQGLVAAVTTTGALAILFGGPVLWAFGVASGALVAYVGVLVHLRASAEQARRTVRRLPVRPTPRSPTSREQHGLLPQRVAVGDGRA